MRSSDKQSRRGLVRTLAVILITVASAALPARAHVGSPDTYAEGNAGPYRLFVTIRPPTVIPGVAEIEVRSVPGKAAAGATVTGIQIAPIPLTGEASKHPPVADPMKQSSADRQFFTGALWIMAPGSWQVRFTVAGSQGTGVLSIPVPATSSSIRGMQTGLGVLLGSLGLLLVAGVVGIVGAAVRDAQLPAGEAAPSASRRRAWIAMGIALVFVVAAAVFGKVWWSSEAGDYAQGIYKPLTMQATLASGNRLDLRITDPGWLKARRLDDFVLDHDHLMHLYLLREPGYDLVYHLHPDERATGNFDLSLPSIPAGQYQLYADVVHANGFPETLVARVTLPEIIGRPLAGDDAMGRAPAITPSESVSGSTSCSPRSGPDFRLPDGYTMVWDNPAILPAKTPESFAFTLLDPAGKAPTDMALYMGMVGHAAFIKNDGSVFAHVHPSGTVSMAALMMAAQENQANASTPPGPTATPAMPDMPGMAMTGVEAASSIPNTVSFPYGFPTPGAYRIFVQMKHGQTVETAAFDACTVIRK